MAGVTLLCLPIQAEPMLFKALTAGDITRSAQLLSLGTATGGLVEFLINPTVGKLSDTHGRKMFMLIGPLYNAIGNILVALFPSNFAICFANRALTLALTTLSGSVRLKLA